MITGRSRVGALVMAANRARAARVAIVERRADTPAGVRSGAHHGWSRRRVRWERFAAQSPGAEPGALRTQLADLVTQSGERRPRGRRVRPDGSADPPCAHSNITSHNMYYVEHGYHGLSGDRACGNRRRPWLLSRQNTLELRSGSDAVPALERRRRGPDLARRRGASTAGGTIGSTRSAASRSRWIRSRRTDYRAARARSEPAVR